MKRFLMLLVFLFACATLLTTAARAGCTNATLIGAYGFQDQGRHVAEDADFRQIANITFDGKGNASGMFTVWFSNFNVGDGPIRLSYSVQPDCRVTWQDVTYGDVGGETYAGVITNNGQQIVYIETTGDPVRSGQAAKVFSPAQGCTNATLIGAYGFQEEGRATGVGAFRSVGITRFDGKGNASRDFTIWYSNFSAVNESGVPISYNVTPDCRSTFTYLNNGETFTGVIVDSGKKIFFMETSGDPIRSGQAEKVKVSTQNVQ
jgi:hypothetical protein